MSRIKNFKIGKRLLAGVLALSITGTMTLGMFQLHKKMEVNRVKGYLEDFVTEDNYVDLSKITSEYKIRDFSGNALAIAMEELDVDYVRMNDSYVYDDKTVYPFIQVTAIDYNNPLWTDQNNVTYFNQYEPIRVNTEDGIKYRIPNEYVLEEVEIYADPIRYDDVKNDKIQVVPNDYEESYSLILKKNK